MKIALASPAFPKNISAGLQQLQSMVADAAAQQAKIICFPESYLPGYPSAEFVVEKSTPQNMQAALNKACTIAKQHNIAIILPMDWYENNSYLNVAFVISEEGKILGYQTKNQLDPSEDNHWVAGTHRQVFEIAGLTFGISICHEGFRYPETVRWAARNGAQVVFHPHFAGSNLQGPQLSVWAAPSNPYYEKAMMVRALENTIYFASCNYTTSFPESASSIIAPDGSCIAYQPYAKEGVLVAAIDLKLATGLLAKRLRNDLY
ncbi:MAG: carbon-nitrogen hydrolase family protein [Ferruginibacter sp.]